MTPHTIDHLTEALDLTRQARLRAFAAARRHPNSTWIDAYGAIHRAEGQLAAAGAQSGGRDEGNRSARTCRELLSAARTALASIAPGEGPTELVLVQAYLRDAVVEVEGREP